MQLAVALLLCVEAWHATAQTAPAESDYLRRRDSYINRFVRSTNNLLATHPAVNGSAPKAAQLAWDALAKQDQQALIALTPAIKNIVGEVRLHGFDKPQEINLQTLLPELGSGMLDGLRLAGDSQAELVVTTEGLLSQFVSAKDREANRPQSKDWRDWVRGDGFYHHVFDPGAAITPFLPVPIKPKTGMPFAYAVLALTAQDIGAFVPGDLLVVAARGDSHKQVYLFKLSVAPLMTELAVCKREWQVFEAKHLAALARYRASGLVQTQEFDSAQNFVAQGFAAWQACYARLAPAQPFFTDAKEQAQRLVDQVPQAMH